MNKLILYQILTGTRITRNPRQVELNLLSLDQDFTEIYPDNSNSPLKAIFRFPLEFEFTAGVLL